MNERVFDLLVVGGGINGAGIARDAAGRGLSVLLVEAKDLAQGTSSASSKMLHGGLRYLEKYDFKLVREALIERENLLSIAPHLIDQQQFIIPEKAGQGRPSWMMRVGLFLYDHLAKRRRMDGSGMMDLKSNIYALPLKDVYTRAYFYHDCQVDDSRLVVLNALDAAERGAEILTRTKCKTVKPEGKKWEVVLEKQDGDETIYATAIVNATGPWVRKFLEENDLAQSAPHMRLVKGSHLIVKKLYEGDHSYLFQNDDGRVIFMWPYQDDYTLIGTTEEEFKGSPYEVQASPKEVDYLCRQCNVYLKKEITPDDVIWAFSGVRPLMDEKGKKATNVSRDLYLYRQPNVKPLMYSVYGGKLTTYRTVAEKTVNAILHLDSRYSPPWTANEPLPGGEFPDGHFAVFIAQVRRVYNWLPEPLLYRYAKLYGARMDVVLEGCHSMKCLGRNFGADIYEAELVYSQNYEWCISAEDFLFRRTKLGLSVSDEVRLSLEKFWKKR
ncbi:MAG: glycerol-3-phosphate dehydrogenase [Micavibrio sp.]|nr:glycerol-3-phosphate dehydrogenase [Micavibrio sp.]